MAELVENTSVHSSLPWIKNSQISSGSIFAFDCRKAKLEISLAQLRAISSFRIN